jgi:hypothetical protein
MSQNRPARISLTILASLVALLNANPVLACSVCYGDPNSTMTKGAQAGVLVLLGVIGVVLIGLASLLLFWMRRAAKLKAVEAASQAPPVARQAPLSHA